MSDRIHVEIVTPSSKVLSRQCDQVYLPGSKGEMGVLPAHAELVSVLSMGSIRIQDGVEILRYAVRGGFLEVQKNQVSILADEVISRSDMNSEALQAERRELEEKLISDSVGIDAREELFLRRDWIAAQQAVLSE